MVCGLENGQGSNTTNKLKISFKSDYVNKEHNQGLMSSDKKFLFATR